MAGTSTGAYVFNGTSWTSSAGAPDLMHVSCPSAQFCAAVSGNNVPTYNGTSWTSPTFSGGPPPESLSCSGPTFCVAVGQHDELTFNGSVWSSPIEIDTAGNLIDVSCPETNFCAAVDDAGNALTYGSTVIVPGGAQAASAPNHAPPAS